MNIQSVPLEQITGDPNQPRTFFDKEELGNLAANIAEHGVLEPILIRNNALHNADVADAPVQYIIIAGERRWRAAKMAGLTDIPAILRDDLSTYSIEEVSVAENTSRQDLNPIEEGRRFQRFVDRGMEAALIARKVGRSVSHVNARLSLLMLDDQIQRLVEVGQLSATTAGIVARLPKSHQHLAMRAVISEGLSDMALRLFVDELIGRLTNTQLFTPEEVLERSRQAMDLKSRFDRGLEQAIQTLNLLVDNRTKALLATALKGDHDLYIEKLLVFESEIKRLRQEIQMAKSVANVLDTETVVVPADEVPA